MDKISYLKIVAAIVFVLIVISIGYAGWESFNNGKSLTNTSNTQIETITPNNQKTSEIDTSGWKTYN